MATRIKSISTSRQIPLRPEVAQIFLQEVGKTPARHVEDLRLEAVRRRLELTSSCLRRSSNVLQCRPCLCHVVESTCDVNASRCSKKGTRQRMSRPVKSGRPGSITSGGRWWLLPSKVYSHSVCKCCFPRSNQPCSASCPCRTPEHSPGVSCQRSARRDFPSN
jgi:hypothetical protein